MTTYGSYADVINNRLAPMITDTVFLPGLDPIKSVATQVAPRSGAAIYENFRSSFTSTASSYTKGDVDPASSSQTIVQPYWNKDYYHVGVEVHGIDVSQGVGGDVALDYIRDQMEVGARSLLNTVLAAYIAQWTADIDSSGTAYSDASLSRSTYTTLASYEETTDTSVTVAYMNGLIKGTTVDKDVMISDYVFLGDPNVYHVLKPLAAALNVWNQGVPTGAATPMGYSEMSLYNGTPWINVTGMTTGAVFMVRKQDLKIMDHMPLEWKVVESGRHSSKMVGRIGTNSYIVNPGFAGKLLNKD